MNNSIAELEKQLALDERRLEDLEAAKKVHWGGITASASPVPTGALPEWTFSFLDEWALSGLVVWPGDSLHAWVGDPATQPLIASTLLTSKSLHAKRA